MHGGHKVVISGFHKNEFIITDSERLSDKSKGKIRRDMEFMLNCTMLSSPPSGIQII